MAPPYKPLPLCDVCSQPVKRHGRTTCSRQCAGKLKHQGEDATCPICGTTFHASPSTVAAGRAQHCSWKCRVEAARRARILPPCAYCGGHRERKPRYGIKPTGIYCSYSCSRHAAVARWRLAHPWPQCAVCDQPVKRRERTYCSRRCAGRRAPCPPQICPVCGKDFANDGKPRSQQHCSAAHAAVGRRRREMRTCARCGELFEAPLRTRQRYCNYACYAPGKPPRRGPGEGPRRCARCWEPLPSGTRHRQRFCSRGCARRGSGHARNPSIMARDARIIALAAQRVRGRALRARLVAEEPSWGNITPEVVRQVLYRAAHPHAGGRGRQKSNVSGRRPVAPVGTSA